MSDKRAEEKSLAAASQSWNWLALSQKNGESSSSSSGRSNSAQSHRNAVKSKRPLLNRPPTNSQAKHAKPKTISTATEREQSARINTGEVEVFSRLRITERTISAEVLHQEMEGRKFIKLQQMDRVPKDTFTNGENLSAGVYTSAPSKASSSGWNPIITKKRKRNDAAGGVLGVPTVLSASGAVVQRGRAQSDRFVGTGASNERRRGNMSLMDQLREPPASMNAVVRSSATVKHPSSRAQKIMSAVLAGDGKPMKRPKTKKVDMIQFMNADLR
ncbi:hypothetical protein AM588_10002625 [Phytophthora nicotianae]|uniref:Uncharacterized protein n=1 Tax=Phytophthora nicotianae TaxID=4792 RepID=A0A0W8D1Q9_PHYNI|nr:hypothetical protein AM588_10002625 [Phytophthora nicotianae]